MCAVCVKARAFLLLSDSPYLNPEILGEMLQLVRIRRRRLGTFVQVAREKGKEHSRIFQKKLLIQYKLYKSKK